MSMGILLILAVGAMHGIAPTAKMDRMEEEELIFGKNAVLAFLEQAEDEADNSLAKINKIMIDTGGKHDGRVERIQFLARQKRIPVHSCERQKLDYMCGPDRRHQGVVALVSPAEMWSLERFLQKMEIDRAELDLAGKSMDGYMVAIADGVEDPHNLGAIIRVAEAAGVKALLIPLRRAAGLTGTVAKISAGALATLP